MTNSQSNKVKKDALELGLRIKRARGEVGVSQKELGDALELTDKAISAYEMGRAMPNVPQIRTMSKLLNKPVTYFVEPVDVDAPLQRIEQEIESLHEKVDHLTSLLEK